MKIETPKEVEPVVACCICKTEGVRFDTFHHNDRIYCGGCLANTLSPVKALSLVHLQHKQEKALKVEEVA